MELKQTTVEANGLDFACLEVGEGPLALFLHGFPDTAWTWSDVLPAAADAGFRAVAPFMRGYHPTGPAPDGRYQTGALSQDACALHEALGGDQPGVIVGHDWGALATYGAAAMEPDRWERVVGMAVPPALGAAGIFSNYGQIRRSSYMFIFLSPMAEFIVPAGDWAFLEGLWADWSPGHDGCDDLARVIAALTPDGCLSAALGYYRHALQPELVDPALDEWQAATGRPPPQPTLYLHGRNDGCIGVELSATTADGLNEQSRVDVLDGVGHFLHREQPDVVVPKIVDFITT